MIKKPIYNDDNLTPEEERALMAIPVPGARQAPPPPMMPQPQFTMNDLVRKKLMAQMQGNRGVDSPYDEYNKASIESGALSGIAGGMAQLGTVHGKTPDPSPYIKASQRMLDPLKQSAMQIEKERAVDPRILAYLTKNQPKAAASKLLPQRNAEGFYLEQDPGGTIKPSAFKGYDAPKDSRDPKPEGYNLPIDKKKEVEHLASDIAAYKTSKAELDAGIREYSLALDDLKSQDNKANRDKAVRVGQSLLKILNSPRGSDAVGVEEVGRLGNALSFQFANVNNPGAFWGYDFPGFFKQIQAASGKIGGTISTIQQQIDQNMGRTPPSQAAPASQGGGSKTTLKSAKELP